METLFRDIQHSMKAAVKRPAFSLAVILTLGLAIGANVAVFALVNTVLLSPLPYPESDRIVGAWVVSPVLRGPARVRQSEATYLHIRDRTTAFESFALSEPRSFTVNDGTRPTRVSGALVTPSIFSVLRVAPVLGRSLTQVDELPGAEPVVILSNDHWRTAFGRDASVVGRTIEVDGVVRRIAGVLGPDVAFPTAEAQLWVPLEIDPAAPVPLDFVYTGYGRLRADASVELAADDITRLINSLPDAYPQIFPRPLVDRAEFRGLVVSLRNELVGDVRDVLWIVYGTVFVVLLLASANVASLFVVRNAGRQRELGIRSALGAGYARLLAQLGTESAVYALSGAALGIALAAVGLAAFSRVGGDLLPRLAEVSIGSEVLAFTVLISTLSAFVFGLIPAITSRRLELGTVLRSGGRSVGATRSHMRLRTALVASQVALALVLLMNAGLLLRSFWSLRNVEPGFQSENVLGLRIFLPEKEYPAFDQVVQFYTELADQLRGLRGVDEAALVNYLPLRDGRSFHAFDIEDFPREADEIPPTYLTKAASEDYFRTLGIPLLAGRPLQRRDIETRSDAVVISDALAKRYWPDADPIGRRIRYTNEERWYSIVGVVGSVRDRSLQDPPAEVVYVPLLPEHIAPASRNREISIAISGANPEALISPVRTTIQELDPNLPLFDIRTMDEVLSAQTARSRYTMFLLAAAAASALFLGLIGLYGVLANAVAQRRREIGVRIALGARPESVRWMIVRQALTVVSVGAGVGAIVTLGTTRFLSAILFGVRPTDLPTFIVVLAFLSVTSWLAARVPAQRAARVDPVIALREE